MQNKKKKRRKKERSTKMHARCEIDDYTSRLGQLLHLLIYEFFLLFLLFFVKV